MSLSLDTIRYLYPGLEELHLTYPPATEDWLEGLCKLQNPHLTSLTLLNEESGAKYHFLEVAEPKCPQAYVLIMQRLKRLVLHGWSISYVDFWILLESMPDVCELQLRLNDTFHQDTSAARFLFLESPPPLPSKLQRLALSGCIEAGAPPPMPLDLASLTALTSLQLRGMGVTNSVLTSLSSLTRLKVLHLSCEHHLTKEALPAFQALSRLTELKLHECPGLLAGSRGAWEGLMGRLPELRSLSVRGAAAAPDGTVSSSFFSEPLSLLGSSLTHLAMVDLIDKSAPQGYGRQRRPPGQHLLSRLQSLDLHGWRMADGGAELKDWVAVLPPTLTSLRLGGRDISPVAANLLVHQLTCLEELDVSNCNGVAEVMDTLACCLPRLKRLVLDRCKGIPGLALYRLLLRRPGLALWAAKNDLWERPGCIRRMRPDAVLRECNRSKLRLRQLNILAALTYDQPFEYCNIEEQPAPVGSVTRKGKRARMYSVTNTREAAFGVLCHAALQLLCPMRFKELQEHKFPTDPAERRQHLSSLMAPERQQEVIQIYGFESAYSICLFLIDAPRLHFFTHNWAWALKDLLQALIRIPLAMVCALLYVPLVPILRLVAFGVPPSAGTLDYLFMAGLTLLWGLPSILLILGALLARVLWRSARLLLPKRVSSRLAARGGRTSERFWDTVLAWAQSRGVWPI